MFKSSTPAPSARLWPVLAVLAVLAVPAAAVAQTPASPLAPSDPAPRSAKDASHLRTADVVYLAMAGGAGVLGAVGGWQLTESADSGDLTPAAGAAVAGNLGLDVAQLVHSLAAWSTFRSRRTLTYSFGLGAIRYGGQTAPHRTDSYVTHGVRYSVDFLDHWAGEFAVNGGTLAENDENKDMSRTAFLSESGLRYQLPLRLSSAVALRPFASLRFGFIVTEFHRSSTTTEAVSCDGPGVIACSGTSRTYRFTDDRMYGLGGGLAAGVDLAVGPFVLAPEYVMQYGYMGDSTSLFHNLRLHAGLRY